MLEFYKNNLGYKNMPEFLKKYLNVPSLVRLKYITYFCGMDYASKDIYNFSEHITRYDHSITTALNVWNFTNNKVKTIAALFHDISTPCFSHVIDYMNKDYEKQESTEFYTEKILKSDKYLLKCLKQDSIDINDIINFKKYTIVDNERPKLCADRFDGIILTSIAWTKEINTEEINSILNDLQLYKNEANEEEIGFKSIEIANRVLELNDIINEYCHTNEDIYFMECLANITKKLIEKNYIKYSDLYKLKEEDIFNKIKRKKDKELLEMLNTFKTILWVNIPEMKNKINIKNRNLNPLVKGIRLKNNI